MDLFLVTVMILVIQHSSTQAVSPLPKIRDNKLDQGMQKHLLKRVHVKCGQPHKDPSKLFILTIKEALRTEIFKSQPFTESLLGTFESPTISGDEAAFRIVKIKGKRYLHALQIDASGERVFWLRYGHRIDIPQHPTADQPQYVFSSDFSGGSWTVTPLKNGYLRLRYVTDEADQFNNLTLDQIGGPVSYAMQYKHYGYTVEATRLVENSFAFAYMHYSGSKRRWTLYVQQQMCIPEICDTMYSNNTLTSVTLLEHNDINDFYFNKSVTNTKAYYIREI